MAGKKKKPVANPSRGFATSSLPSKARLDPVTTTTTITTPTTTTSSSISQEFTVKASTTSTSNTISPGKLQNGDQTSIPILKVENPVQNVTPEELEQQLERDDLQIFVETHGPKVTKDSQRQISKSTTDCRLLRSQSHPLDTDKWFPEQVVNDILDLTKRSLSQQFLQSSSSSKISVDDWVIKLWTLYKVLSDFHIPHDRIISLFGSLQLSNYDLRNTYVWGLDECLDMLSLDDPVILPPYDMEKQNIHLDVRKLDHDLVQNDSRSSRSSSKHPSKHVTPATSGTVTPSATEIIDDFEVSDLESDTEPDHLVDIYLSTKSKLFKIHPNLVDDLTKSNKGSKKGNQIPPVTSPGIRKLQDKLKKIENDSLFDSGMANIRWVVEKTNLVREKAFDRKVAGLKEGLSRFSPKMNASTDESNESNIVGGEEGEESNMLGAMFAGDGDVEVNPNDPENPIVLRDFGKPSGFSPKKLLEDYCRSRDSTCRVNFQLISPTQYSCRHSVSIFWTKAQDKINDDPPVSSVSMYQNVSLKNENLISNITFSMLTIATPDRQQSESYVATFALFCLLSQYSKDEKSYMKLGQSWRDLWDEFLQIRNDRRDKFDRSLVKELRKLVTERLDKDQDTILLSSRKSPHRNSIIDENQNGNSRILIKTQIAEKDTQKWYERMTSHKYQEMQQYRLQLPIFQFRDHALITIMENPITILCGETGCGKSTQLPAYILEQHLIQGQYCKVLCTEPRRISAISLAQRVSEELGESHGQLGTMKSFVGYTVRLESKSSSQTRLIYATVGVVLRMLESKNGLDEFTHLIIDEVHERSIETDFLLIILKDLLKRRPDLRVILMSATVDASKFSSYLNDAPIITVPGRTFPVGTLYLEDAIELTKYTGGRQDKILKDEEDNDPQGSGLTENLDTYSNSTRATLAEYDEYQIDYRLIISIIEKVLKDPSMTFFNKAILVFLPGIGEIRELNNLILSHPGFEDNLKVCPLHSSISSEEQQGAFVIPPNGITKIVLSTNIAETGVTIPDVTCVIDTGKHKEMRFDERRQMSKLVQSFISRANAQQRRGRAGRVQEGICFHLFTKQRHDTLLSPQQTPEMLRLSLQDLIMRVKICNLGEAESTLALAMDPPSSKNVRRAIDSLIEVGALTTKEELTPLGKQLSKLPLDANLGKLCILSSIFGCLDAGLTIAAILSSKSPFVVPFGSRDQADTTRLGFARGDSDLLTAYNAYCAWRRLSETPHQNVFTFCRKNFLSPQVLNSIEDLKSQLFTALCDTKLVTKSNSEFSNVKGHTHAHGRKFLHMLGAIDSNGTHDLTITTIVAWSFYPKILLRDGKGWRSITNNQTVSIHPSSLNRGAKRPQYLSFYSIMQSGPKGFGPGAAAANALSTSVVHEFPLLLLAGDVDFKMHAGVVTLDLNRLRFSVREWRVCLAVRVFRAKMEELVRRAVEYPGQEVPLELQLYKDMFEKVCRVLDKDL